MEHTIKVTLNKGNWSDAIVRCYDWSSGTASEYALSWEEVDGAFVAVVDLESGDNQITCDLLLGTEVTIDLDPGSPITDPAGAAWPVTPTLLATQTEDIFSYFFSVPAAAVGGEA